MKLRVPAASVRFRCANIGYQGRRVDDMCELLSRAGVPVLIDVRERAWSQRPEFRKEALRQALARHGIDYLHLKVAGNPYRPKKGETVDPKACEVVYAAHLADHPEVVREVVEAIKRFPGAALFCYEASRACCHRGVLLKAVGRLKPTIDIVDL